jgi:hypothetical protein
MYRVAAVLFTFDVRVFQVVNRAAKLKPDNVCAIIGRRQFSSAMKSA